MKEPNGFGYGGMNMKKKAKQRHQSVVRCPYCGALADLRPAAEIYHDDSRDDLLYVCRNYPRWQCLCACAAWDKAAHGPSGEWGIYVICVSAPIAPLTGCGNAA